jgi:hypothetical protein
MVAGQPLGRADAVERRHVEIERDRVRPMFSDRGERLLAVGDRA